MEKRVSPLENENGAVLIVSLLILTLLTLIGISATDTSIMEIKISGIDRAHKQAFYNAEAAYPAILPILDDIRNGMDTAEFTDNTKPNYYPALTFDGNPNCDFWNEPLDDGDSTAVDPDITIPSIDFARVDVDQLESELGGESIINRAGYEGLGKGLASSWKAYYRVVTRGYGGGHSDAASNVQVGIISVR